MFWNLLLETDSESEAAYTSRQLPLHRQKAEAVVEEDLDDDSLPGNILEEKEEEHLVDYYSMPRHLGNQNFVLVAVHNIRRRRRIFLVAEDCRAEDLDNRLQIPVDYSNLMSRFPIARLVVARVPILFLWRTKGRLSFSVFVHRQAQGHRLLVLEYSANLLAFFLSVARS